MKRLFKSAKNELKRLMNPFVHSANIKGKIYIYPDSFLFTERNYSVSFNFPLPV